MLAQPVMPAVENGPPCVLDVGFSLAPTLPVWLPQAHWSIVEDLNFFSRDRRLLCRLSNGGSAPPLEIVSSTVAAWREARDVLGFESTPQLYWHEGGRAGS